MVPGRDLGRLLEAREREMEEGKEMEGEGLRVVVEDVDHDEVGEYEDGGEEEEKMGSLEGQSEERGRSMARRDSSERSE
jgi:hypothetical protein